MRITLSEIDIEPKSFDQKLEVDAAAIDSPVVEEPVRAHLVGKVSRYGDIVRVDGRAELEAKVICGRCLEIADWTWDGPLDIELRVPDPGAAPGFDEEMETLEGDAIELVEVALWQILLELPMRIVCREDCQGLCPGCGRNLNEGPCDCEAVVDSRWQILEALKGDLPS